MAERGPCQEKQTTAAPPKEVIRKEPSHEREGFECELVQPPPAALLQTECSICLQILRQPHLISCCGHNFCRQCIERIEKDGKVCPLCNEADFSLMYNKGLERSLKELEVQCKYCTSGCEWSGKLGSYERHLNMEPDPEHCLEGCGFVMLACIHGCGEPIPRRLLASHQGEECPKRPYSCDYCQDYDSVFEDVACNHWPECKQYLLSCPNQCTPNTFERQNLDDHLSKDCPLTVVNCDFLYAGCEILLPRKDMPAHLENNISHLSLLAVMNQTLTKKLLNKEEEIAALKETTETMKQEIDQLKDAKKETDRLMHEVAEIARKQEQDKSLVRSLHSHIGIVPVDIIMTKFAQHKSHYDDWYSEPFFTHSRGYRMCLNIEAKHTHVSVYVALMQSKFDDYLKWPFRGDIVIQLLNQEKDEQHYKKTLCFTDKTPDNNAGRVIENRGHEYGWPEFISHTRLSYNKFKASKCQYLKYDCLHFQVVEVNCRV